MLAQAPVSLSGEGMAQNLGKTSSRLDDAELVRRFQSGSDPGGAIEALFARYAAASYAFFCRSVGDRRQAEDLNQELYLNVIQSLPRFRQESSFKTWLFRLAYHHLSNVRRRLRTHLDERHNAAPDELWEELLSDPQASAESVLSAEETRALLRLCLARLPEIERAVILGRYYHGTTLRELTEELSLSNASGARAYLIAGQRKLRRCIERRTKENADG